MNVRFLVVGCRKDKRCRHVECNNPVYCFLNNIRKLQEKHYQQQIRETVEQRCSDGTNYWSLLFLGRCTRCSIERRFSKMEWRNSWTVGCSGRLTCGITQVLASAKRRFSKMAQRESLAWNKERASLRTVSDLMILEMRTLCSLLVKRRLVNRKFKLPSPNHSK